jgi:hypothetical protein
VNGKRAESWGCVGHSSLPGELLAVS